MLAGMEVWGYKLKIPMPCPVNTVGLDTRQRNDRGGKAKNFQKNKALWATDTELHQWTENTRKVTITPKFLLQIPGPHALRLTSQCFWREGGTEDTAQNNAYPLLGNMTKHKAGGIYQSSPMPLPLIGIGPCTQEDCS